MAVRLGLIRINLLPLLNLNNLFVSETCTNSCAIVFSFSHCGKKNPKIVSETCAKWSQIGTFCESQGLPKQIPT